MEKRSSETIDPLKELDQEHAAEYYRITKAIEKLKKGGLTDEEIKDIKKMLGDSDLDWSKVSFAQMVKDGSLDVVETNALKNGIYNELLIEQNGIELKHPLSLPMEYELASEALPLAA